MLTNFDLPPSVDFCDVAGKKLTFCFKGEGPDFIGLLESIKAIS
jgi:hypothetical protein